MNFSTELVYQGSRDGFLAEDFHSRCDDIGPNVSLLKTDKDVSIAGFTSASWASPDEQTEISDKTAVLFNLTNKISFPCKDHTKAISCNKNNGPYFG